MSTVVALLILAAYMTAAVAGCRLLCHHFDRLIARRNATADQPKTVPAGSSITDAQIIAALTQWGDEQAARDADKQQREEEDRP
jgi:hypothetical protein